MDSGARHTGMRGEDLACRYLERKGYRILSRNYRGGKCELDIIAETGDTIVFCEVKTARSEACGPPFGWIKKTKIRHIARAAREYVITHRISGRPLRFDVISIEVREGHPEFTHIETAFWAPADV
jgi:putative endonuclease